MAADVVRIADLAEGDRLAPLTKRVLLLCFLVMVVDNYDNTAISFAMPQLVREWHIDKVTVGSIFTAGIFGLMVGSIIFGWLGDRFGRKTGLLAGLVWFGLVTLCVTRAASVPQLVALRFLAGLGIGGALPNAVALVNEYSPRRIRVFAIAVIFAGYTLGGSGGGFIAAGLMPIYGWPVVFVVGGILPLLLAAALLLWLPESIRFLSLRRANDAKVRRLARALRPDLRLAPDVRLVGEIDDDKAAGIRFADLFRGPLRAMTPLLWVLYIANSMAVFAITNWLPFLAEAAGLPPVRAALAATLWSIGGTLGGLIASWFADRVGLRAIVVFILIGCPMTASLGYWAGDVGVLFGAIFFAGVFVVGTQNSLHGIAGSIYPTQIRSNGVGWALGIAKIGSISGPFAVGLLLTAGLGVKQLFLTTALPLSVGAVASLLLMRLYNRYVHNAPSRRSSADDMPLGALPAVTE